MRTKALCRGVLAAAFAVYPTLAFSQNPNPERNGTNCTLVVSYVVDGNGEYHYFDDQRYCRGDCVGDDPCTIAGNMCLCRDGGGT